MFNTKHTNVSKYMSTILYFDHIALTNEKYDFEILQYQSKAYVPCNIVLYTFNTKTKQK